MYNQGKLTDLCHESSFLLELISQKTSKDVKNLFLQNGVDLNFEEINSLKELINSKLRSGEIEDEQLQKVCGGNGRERIGAAFLASAALEALFLWATGNSQIGRDATAIARLEGAPAPSWAEVARLSATGVDALFPGQIHRGFDQLNAWWNH